MEWMGFDTQAGHLGVVVRVEEHPLQHSVQVRSASTSSPLNYECLRKRLGCSLEDWRSSLQI
jgi:hypothetical protein